MHSPNIGPVYRQNLHISHVKVCKCIHCKHWTQLTWTYLLRLSEAQISGLWTTANSLDHITWYQVRGQTRANFKFKHFTFCNGKYLRVFKKHHLEQIRLKAAFILRPKMILGVRKVTFLLVAGAAPCSNKRSVCCGSSAGTPGASWPGRGCLELLPPPRPGVCPARFTDTATSQQSCRESSGTLRKHSHSDYLLSCRY